MKYQQWNLRGGKETALRSMERQGVSPLSAAVLCARGIDTPELAAAFLDDGEHRLHDPFLLRDMDRAVARLTAALERGETVAVYGDYDVDGITSTTLLTEFLTSRGGRVVSYIPDRIEEGYGLNREALSLLHAQNVSLIVTVDCGITAVQEVEEARALGMDVIITDHHRCKNDLPAAAAVVDPQRCDCSYPFPELAGVGVALKLALAMTPEAERHDCFLNYAELAAVGTVADVMKLTDENRSIVRIGLARLEHTSRPGLRALLREAGAEGKPVTAVTVGYGLAPRINAAGRMEKVRLALEMLLTRDEKRGEELAVALCDLNRERQAIELGIYEECIAELERCPQKAGPTIVLAGEGWHQGVVGIVASRLTEKFSCPTFMICLDGGRGKGSCRSFGGFNLFAALERCADLLEEYGGHELAAGFTIQEVNIPAFKRRMDALVESATGGEGMVSVLDIDGELEDPEVLSAPAVEGLSQLEPFGAGNPKPVFSISGCTVVSCANVGGGRHLKLRLRFGTALLDGIFFSVTAAAAGVSPGERVDVAFTPQINEYRGSRTVQLQLCDLREAPTRAQAERILYEKLRGGMPLTRREAEMLLPERDEFAAVWRFLRRNACDRPLEDSVSRLVKTIARTFPAQRPYIRTMVCLEVMDERGLIDMEHAADRLCISLHENSPKVDLEQSAIMIQLRSILREEGGQEYSAGR